MATPALLSLSELDQEAQQSPGQSPKTANPQAGDEATADAPKGRQQAPDEIICTEEEKKHLLDTIRKYTERYAPVRRRRVRNTLRAREYFKGNQYISFSNDNFSWFDPLEALFDGDPDKEDLGVYRYVSNIYQMLALSFVAALSPQVPKTEYMPADAERLEDTATAKAASTLQKIIERQNKIKDIQKMELLLLWTDGCYYSYTRFVVDGDRNKTHREPQWGMVDTQVSPDRFQCPECGATIPAAQMANFGQPMCPQCGNKLSPSNYYPGETAPIPKITGYTDVPNGQVTIGTYGLLNVITAPYANELWQTPMLRLDEEVELASIRASYPDNWDELNESQTTGNMETETERLARQQVLNMVGGRNNMTSQEMPTFSRSWLQSWALNTIEDKTTALGLVAKFPNGVMVVHCGDTFLEARTSRIRDHWTWCGMVKGYGLNPPGIGDVVMDVQDKINDASNSLAEHMDRNASPTLLVDGAAIDTRKLNNAPMLAGVMKEVPRKNASNRPLSDFIFQPQIHVDSGIYDYIDKLTLFAQLVSGVLPQIFGGSDKNVKTASGQQQMLNTALGRLGLFWDNIREEHAEKSGVCVRCAADNYTDDILNVVGGGGSDYRNEYVRINDLSGEFHAYPQTDQGFPQTYAEIQQRLQEMFLEGKDNPLFMELMEEPVNQKLFAQYMLPGNFIIPGAADTSKCMQVINTLLKGRANIMEGVAVPSILVDERYDDPDKIIKIVRQWAIENYFTARVEQPDGWANVSAYFDMANELVEEKAAQQAVSQEMAAAHANGGAGAGPPPGAEEPVGAGK